jgi:hypothetical protein
LEPENRTLEKKAKKSTGDEQDVCSELGVGEEKKNRKHKMKKRVRDEWDGRGKKR